MTDIQKALPQETRDLVALLAQQAPSLADLSPAQAQAVAQAVLGDFLKDEMRRAVLGQRIRFEDEAQRFLGDQRSQHTRRAYGTALVRLRAWLEHKGLTLADLTPALADDYIRDLRAEGQDEDTARLRIGAASSFFTFLERRFSEIRNPFRGTKARPRSSWTVATIPTKKEAQALLAAADPLTRAALTVILETGLRIGALPELRVKEDGTFYTLTKGKRFEGFEPLSAAALGAIRAAGLPAGRPFDPAQLQGRGGTQAGPARMTAALASRVARLSSSLAAAGKIAAPYSPHDFRHAWAEAHAGRGLLWIRDRLGHASVSVTERYMRNTLGINTKAG